MNLHLDPGRKIGSKALSTQTDSQAMPQRDTPHQAQKRRAKKASPAAPPTAGEVRRLAAGLGAEPDEDQAALLAAYLDILVKWNARMNLVGPGDWRTIMETLVADSLRIAPFLAGIMEQEKPLCLDIGAGAGLPGIPLRILWRPGHYVLVEPREKRALFMQNALARLKLPGTEVFRGRAQDLPPERRTADLVLSRAFMPWPGFLDLARTLVRPGGAALVLANDPPPDANMIQEKAPGWTLARTLEYPAAGTVRYCWFLLSSSMSM